ELVICRLFQIRIIYFPPTDDDFLKKRGVTNPLENQNFFIIEILFFFVSTVRVIFIFFCWEGLSIREPKFSIKDRFLFITKQSSKIREFKRQYNKNKKKNNIVCIENDIPENIKFTYANEFFYHYDGGISDPERIKIFTTDTHLLHLKMSNNWNCDEPFCSCLQDFCQIYVIMAKKHEKNIS
ncbi:hypothetical protein DMUE_5641, partial [Dictyocoela muelleri]